MAIGRFLVWFILLTMVACAQKQVQRIEPALAVAVARPSLPATVPPESRVGEKQPGKGAEAGPPGASSPAVEPAAVAAALPPEPTIKVVRIPVLPSVASVNQRRMIYADKLAQWETLSAQAAELDLGNRMPSRWPDCFAAIAELSRAYSALNEVLVAQDSSAVDVEPPTGEPWQIYQADIAFLEGGCEQVFLAGAELVRGVAARDSDTVVGNSEATVAKYAEEGRYEDVITAYHDLVNAQPDRAFAANTNKIYGLALLRTGKFETAAQVLATVLENMRPSNEERSLRRLVADLLLASGSLDEAQRHYRKLADYFESRKGDDRWVADQLALLGGVDVTSPEFPLYLEGLKGYLAFDGHHIPQGMREVVEKMEGDFRESPLTDQARQMLGQLEDLIREWAAARLDEVDLFVANNDYGAARALLEQMLFDDLPGPVHDTVQGAMDNLLQAEARYQEEQRAIQAQALAALWDKALWLLDSQKYDEAIESFIELLGTAYDAPARARIKTAAEMASIEMRRKSANIFVRARNERDDERKRQLLLESWQLLHDITIKYPEVELIDKVRQNLAIIEKHIELFDPTMLPGAKAVVGVDRETLP